MTWAKKSTRLSPSAIQMRCVRQIGYYFKVHIIRTISHVQIVAHSNFTIEHAFRQSMYSYETSQQLIRIHLWGCWIQLKNFTRMINIRQSVLAWFKVTKKHLLKKTFNFFFLVFVQIVLSANKHKKSCRRKQ